MLLDKIERFLKILTSQKVPFCIIGGVAVLLHGGRASTIDFDLYVVTDDVDSLRKAVKGRRVKILLSTPEQLRLSFEEMNIDVLIADPILGKIVVKRAKKLSLGRNKVPVATPEDLIIMKTLADRPIDRRDVEELRELFASSLDKKYISSQLSKIKRATEKV
jgi:hypothetical protein